MNDFILKESISPAGLECPEEFEHYIITDGTTTILAKDDQEDHGQALMLLAVLNAYGGKIWLDESHQLIIGHQKDQISHMTAAVAAKDAEIERLREQIENAFRWGYKAAIQVGNKGQNAEWQIFKSQKNL